MAKVISEEVRSVYAPMLSQFCQFATEKRDLKPVELFWAFEERFGSWFATVACPKLGIAEGACIIDAMLLASKENR